MPATFELDRANEVHARTLRRLETDEIGWLGTNGRNGYPHAVPVWFFWHEGTIVVFVQPESVKTRNIRADPKVLFHLETDEAGDDVHIIRGSAAISPDSTSVWLDRMGDAYVEKYRAGLDRLGWKIDRIRDEYSVAVVITPERFIGWL
ncbi:pyridoxamine 5'-phosphate oxidase family protein [Microbacterium immunditiarum]|uniref:PPOX class probable F420-dependent enzyme n=1 Tax=Microbacterium immunditiarum TaxID=337480 RepID=A0A7Y9KK77_9MICO|nr:pyridoxamine 5'-phosphate oxidase family protein [Microbacterium immunditiarum]NYE18938.1 PPOX class probable F420-dependent enzyme [Microbacterium immunditiarum]